MEFNDDLCLKIFEYAECLFSKREVAEMMSVPMEDAETFFCHPKFIENYNAGRRTTEHKVRKSAIELAINGSAPAQIEVLKIISKLDLLNA